MSNNTATVTVTDITAEPKRRGRKPGSVVWTHERITDRADNPTIMDKAKLAFITSVYGECDPMRLMILSSLTVVKNHFIESDEYKAAKADIVALEAEAEAEANRAKVAKLLESMTPEQRELLKASL